MNVNVQRSTSWESSRCRSIKRRRYRVTWPSIQVLFSVFTNFFAIPKSVQNAACKQIALCHYVNHGIPDNYACQLLLVQYCLTCHVERAIQRSVSHEEAELLDFDFASKPQQMKCGRVKLMRLSPLTYHGGIPTSARVLKERPRCVRCVRA